MKQAEVTRLFEDGLLSEIKLVEKEGSFVLAVKEIGKDEWVTLKRNTHGERVFASLTAAWRAAQRMGVTEIKITK